MDLNKLREFFRKKPRLADILLIVLLVVPTIVTLINTQYFSMHDDQHIARLFLFDKAFKEGDVYPRWVDMLGFGYGYPLFNFYPPLIYFVAEFFHLIGFSLIGSIKMMIITGFITAALGMYWYAKTVFNRYAGILGAILYTYFTYHAVTVYVRGALAEFFTLSILPFVFLALRNLVDKRNAKSCIFFGISFALLILTHPLIAFPSVFYIVVYGGYYYWQMNEKERKELLNAGAKGMGLGLGLSAFFWLPSIIEKRYTYVDDILTRELASYKIHFLCIQQFWYSAWGYGGSGAGCTDGMSFQLGKIHIAFLLISLLGLLVLYFQKRMSSTKSKELLLYVIIVAFTLFMTVGYSSFIWDHVSFLWYLQFPWRFLTFAAVFISLLGSGICYVITKLSFNEIIKQKMAIGVLCVAALACIFVYGKYFFPQTHRPVTDAQMTSFDEIAWRVSRSSFEFVPKGVRTKKSDLGTTILDIEKDSLPTNSYKLVSGRGLVETNELKTSMKSFIVKQDQPVVFQLNTFNFPGWEAYITNSFKNSGSQRLEIDDGNSRKLIQVALPPGEYILTFVFNDTPVRMLANFLTIASIMSIILFRFRKEEHVRYLLRQLEKIKR